MWASSFGITFCCEMRCPDKKLGVGLVSPSSTALAIPAEEIPALDLHDPS